MRIFKENKETGLQFGVNDMGYLFVGDKESGGMVENTPDNYEYCKRIFDYYNGDMEV